MLFLSSAYHVNIQVKKPGTPTEIDLDIEGARQEMGHLHLSASKPTISEKAWNRLSSKGRRKIKEDGDVSGGAGNEQKGLSVCSVLSIMCVYMSCDLSLSCMYM